MVKKMPGKNELTIVPVVTAAGQKLLLQFIFGGTEFDKRTNRSIPDSETNFKTLTQMYPGCVCGNTLVYARDQLGLNGAHHSSSCREKMGRETSQKRQKFPSNSRI